MVNSRLPSAPWLGRWCPAAAGSCRGWPSPPCPTCGLPVSGPCRRMQVSRWWAGWPPGRVWFALGAPEFGAVTTRMGFVMPSPLAEVPALLIRGRGRRRRLALLLGLAEATAAVPGEAEPTSNGRLIESWCSYQPKHGGHHQQSSRHGRPLPACRTVTRPESPIGEPGATTRIRSHRPGRGRGGSHALGPWLVSNGWLLRSEMVGRPTAAAPSSRSPHADTAAQGWLADAGGQEDPGLGAVRKHLPQRTKSGRRAEEGLSTAA
jgi:hypothetical protein